MDLLVEPWIEVLTVDGPATLSLAEIGANLGEVIAVASADPLVDAAILRLLMAIDRAADGDMPRWLASTRNHWNLFDPIAPFWQNTMLDPHLSHSSVAETLFYRHTGNGTVLLDHHHNENAHPISPAEAARGLIMRQQFSVSRIEPFPERVFGTKLAYHAVAACRPLVWIEAANLAQTLAANRFPGPVGQFHFTWPAGVKVNASPAVGGQVDALTWQARSMRLVTNSDGEVSAFVIAAGARYSTETDPQRIPHTTFIQRKKGEPYQVRDVHADRPGWRQLLSAWADPNAPGILSRPAADLPEGARLRLIGLSSFQSRIDGPVVGSLPMPRIDRAAAAALDDALTTARAALAARLIAAGKQATPSNDPSAGGAWWKHLMPGATELHARFEATVIDALEARLPVEAATEQIRQASLELAHPAAYTLSATHPVAAAAASPTPKDTVQ